MRPVKITNRDLQDILTELEYSEQLYMKQGMPYEAKRVQILIEKFFAVMMGTAKFV